MSKYPALANKSISMAKIGITKKMLPHLKAHKQTNEKALRLDATEHMFVIEPKTNGICCVVLSWAKEIPIKKCSEAIQTLHFMYAKRMP